MIVHSLDQRRMVVEKALVIDKDGARLFHGDDATLIEPDVDVWHALFGNKNKAPLVKMINVTSKCNQDCPYCYLKNIKKIPSRFTELSLGMAKKAILSIRDQSVIRIAGGEPTEWPFLVELLKFATKVRRNRIVILTNGINLEDEAYVKQMPNTDQIGWMVTLRDIDDQFLAVYNIAKRRFAYGFNVIYDVEDHAHMTDLTKFCESMNPEEVRYRVIVNHSTGSIGGYQSDMINFACDYFGISKKKYLESCFGMSCFSHLDGRHISRPFGVHTIANPTWRTIILEEVAKCKTYLLSHVHQVPVFETLLPEAMNESKDAKQWRLKTRKDKIN